MWGLIIIVFMMMAFGVASVAHQQSNVTNGVSSNTVAMANSQLFMNYRNAVIAYITANPTFASGAAKAVPVAALSLPNGTVVPAGAGNYVVYSGGTNTIYVWCAAQAGAAGQLVNQLGGDASIGTALSGNFVSPLYGSLAALPGVVPVNDLVSVVQIGT